MDKWNSRKLFFSIGILALTTGLLITKYIKEGAWENVITIICLSYLGAQATVDAFKKR